MFKLKKNILMVEQQPTAKARNEQSGVQPINTLKPGGLTQWNTKNNQLENGRIVSVDIENQKVVVEPRTGVVTQLFGQKETLDYASLAPEQKPQKQIPTTKSYRSEKQRIHNLMVSK